MATDTDIAQADLAELLTILGMGDHARPQSPHEVFQDALSVLRRRLGGTQRQPESAVAADEEDDREVDRILAMSGDDLRAELVTEGHDPDALVRQMKQGLDGTLRLAADRQRWREEAASWRRVAERLQERTNALETGLKPFAAILSQGEPVGPIPRGLLDSRITRNDLRTATKLLATQGTRG
ncbi:hypothetical protein [Methylobacterium sp. Leaf118]|uniref:hypothetical protein n=1 Tax=Methylobacterium sp. Leaf118 TaxID=2876562 RepID=UPI001E367E3C|nr:hypothetical protein [Methylobacterium sp. Leaf118]